MVDAKSCIRKHTPNHSVELRVLLAAHFTDLPVFFICDDYRALPATAVWPAGQISGSCCDGCVSKARADPTGRALPRRCPEHAPRGRRGSGTPYVLIARNTCRQLDEFFGDRRCVTCDWPESQWDTAHPLYRHGAVQCPGCSDADVQAGPQPIDPWADVVVAKPGSGLPPGWKDD